MCLQAIWCKPTIFQSVYSITWIVFQPQYLLALTRPYLTLPQVCRRRSLNSSKYSLGKEHTLSQGSVFVGDVHSGHRTSLPRGTILC